MNTGHAETTPALCGFKKMKFQNKGAYIKNSSVASMHKEYLFLKKEKGKKKNTTGTIYKKYLNQKASTGDKNLIFKQTRI